MKKFQFRLEKLLSYKTQILENELMKLSDLNQQQIKAEHKLNELEKNKEKCINSFKSKINETITPQECSIYENYNQFLNQQIVMSEQEIEMLTEQKELILIEIRNLKKEQKSLEIMKESQQEEYRKEEVKKTELQMDEFVSTASSIEKGNNL